MVKIKSVACSETRFYKRNDDTVEIQYLKLNMDRLGTVDEISLAAPILLTSTRNPLTPTRVTSYSVLYQITFKTKNLLMRL